MGDHQNSSATIENENDDLLGGGDSYGGGQAEKANVSSFESSFPAIDSRNEVCPGNFSVNLRDLELRH